MASRSALRLSRTALVRMNHASLGTLAQTGARPAVAVATHLLAERTSGAWKPSLITSFAAVSAAATAATFTTSCEGAEALSGLKNIRDAKEIVLYQYAVCPFCNKVIAFLDYHKIPYRVVEVNPLTKSEISWSEYKKVPILVIDGEQLNDSTRIMTLLTEKLPKSSGWGKAPVAFRSAEEEKWFKWVDERFVHVLTPNLYRTMAEAMEAFDYITKYGISHTRLKKKHNIVDERKSLYETVGDFTAALGKKKFVGGDSPSLADMSLFGMIRAVRGMTTFADVMANTDLRPWFERMEQAVGPSARMERECKAA